METSVTGASLKSAPVSTFHHDASNLTKGDGGSLPSSTGNNLLHVLAWNVCGFAAVGKLPVSILSQKPIICLTETHLVPNQTCVLPPSLSAYSRQTHAVCSNRKGYSGVSVLLGESHESSKVREVQLPGEYAGEARLLVIEHPMCTVVSVYVPNAGQGLKRLTPRIKLWDPWFAKLIQELTKGSTWPVYVLGDLNVAHTEIDLANPKTNKKNPGFSEEERASFTTLLKLGWVDTWRAANPDKRQYSFFTGRSPGARERNVGWRLDYALASTGKAAKAVHSVRICDEVNGSDHLPIELVINLDALK